MRKEVHTIRMNIGDFNVLSYLNSFNILSRVREVPEKGKIARGFHFDGGESKKRHARYISTAGNLIAVACLSATHSGKVTGP
jgi:hypothetical protein